MAIKDDITEEDVIDAVNDLENIEALPLLTQFYEQETGGDKAKLETRVKEAYRAAKMLFNAKRYEDTLEWLDVLCTKVADAEGPDSEEYAAFTENEEIENLRLIATDKSMKGDDEDAEEDDDDFANDDE